MAPRLQYVRVLLGAPRPPLSGRSDVKRFLVPLTAALLLLSPTVAWCEDEKKEPTPVEKAQKTADEAKQGGVDAQGYADTAWMLVSTGLVLLMVPGLALFYGGMVRRKNVLGTMMHSMVALGILGIEWVLIGYAFAFGKSQ